MLIATLVMLLATPLPEAGVWGHWYGTPRQSDLLEVSGAVVDRSSGEPLAATLQIVDVEGKVMVTATSGTSGAFRIALPRGSEILTVSAPGHAFFLARALKLDDGMRVPLERAARVEGHVRDKTGAPVAGAEVWTVDAARSGWFPAPVSHIARTDSAGFFAVSDATPGIFALHARHPRFLERRVLAGRATADTTENNDVILEARVPLDGVVLDERGRPIAKADVAFFQTSEINSTHPSAVEVTKTDRKGRFRLNASEGKGWIAARGPGLSYGAVAMPSSRELTVHVRNLERAEGVVIDSRGANAAGATIARMSSDPATYDEAAAEQALHSYFSGGLVQVTTDARGRFALPLFDHLNPTVTLLAELPERARVIQEVPRDRRATLRLEDAVTVRGRVMSAGRRIHTEAHVSAKVTTTNGTRTIGQAVDEGTFELLNTGPGHWTLFVVAAGRVNGPSIELDVGTSPPPLLQLELGEIDTHPKIVWHVRGRAVLPDQSAGAGLAVASSTDGVGDSAITRRTGPDGRFEIDVPAGTREICVRRDFDASNQSSGKCIGIPAPDASLNADVGDVELPGGR